jgi:predicted lipid-binding transport protein (Tim44 family)
MKKSRGILGLTLCAALALAPALAEAKAGGSFSGGSRGSRTYNSAPSTPTAPQAKPVERSATSPSQPQRQPQAQPAGAPAAQPSFFQRNPFVSGLLGGLIGAGIGSMLFGGGFFPSGGAGFLGLLLQLAIIGGLVYLGLRIWRSRQTDSQRPAYSYAGLGNEPQQRSAMDVRPLDVATGHVGEAPSVGANDEIGVQPADFEEFERLLAEIQKAWSAGDVGALRRHVTPEMLSYFSEQLSANASAGVENHVEDVKLQQGDLAESWREGNIEYATVAIRWNAHDYTVRTDSGTVVDGSKTEWSDATEVWTFMRSAGGRWLLSAIQQVEAVA